MTIGYYLGKNFSEIKMRLPYFRMSMTPKGQMTFWGHGFTF